MNVNVHELRKQGYKVRIKHKREYENWFTQMTRGEYEREVQELNQDTHDKAYVYSERVLSKGGTTIVELTTPQGEEIVGVAKCSKKENYNRKKGCQIAFGRIFSNHSHKTVN